MEANRLREYRQKRGIGQTELAYRIGRSVGTLLQYEQGNTSPPLPIARRLAAVLNAPLDELFPQGAERPDDDLTPAA